MRVRLAKPARQELLSIWEYVAMDNPLAATKLTQRITDACQRLGRFTKLGKPGRSDDTRELGSRALHTLSFIASCAQRYACFASCSDPESGPAPATPMNS